MKSAKYIFTALAAATLFPAAASAQSYPNQGYWVDGSGKIVTSSTSGQCWHSNEWTPALAVQGCDPLPKRVAVALAPTPTPKAVEPVLTPVAPTPPPTPLVASPPQKITFSADAMFSFDQSKLKPEGETMLQGLVNQLHSSNYENVMLTGHTDRIGSAVYNQKLSERRALEVKKYLVGQNIPSDRIETQGVGETQPLESTKDCKGGQSAKIIACLQADRRVDVEMKGTKK